MAKRSVVHKKESSDFWEEGPVVHQDILVAAVVGTADRDLLALPTGFHPMNGGAMAKLRLWAAGAASDAAAGELVRFRAYTFPAPGRSPSAVDPDDTDQQKEQGAGQLVADYTVVCSGNVIADKHPITSVATPGIRWYEMNEVNAIHYLLDSDAFQQIPDPVLGAEYIGITPVDEIQTVVIVGTGADWTLSFRGETTAVMDETESAASMKTKLEALSTIGAGNIASITEGVDKTYIITFGLDLGGANLPLLVADKGSLTSATPTETTPGVSGRHISFKWDVMAALALHVDVVSMDNTGNATRCAVAIDSVM